MRRLYLDIETLPAHETKHVILKFLHAKKKMKRKSTNTEEEPKDFEQYLLSTSFDGAYGRILCIGYAIDDQPVNCICCDPNEKETLDKFWELVKSISMPSDNSYQPNYGVQFIGHNVMDFDLRFIYQRSIINKVKPAYELPFARYRSYPIYDTWKEWTKWAFEKKDGGTLEHIALALGIPTSKDGIDGSQVYDFYKAGKVNEICEYCKRDVECTRAVYKRMNFCN